MSPGPAEMAAPLSPALSFRQLPSAPAPVRYPSQPVLQRTSPSLQASLVPTRIQSPIPPSRPDWRYYNPPPQLTPAAVTVVPVTQSVGPAYPAYPMEPVPAMPADNTRRFALAAGGLLALIIVGGVVYYVVKKKGS